jgi:hypothetical protein
MAIVDMVKVIDKFSRLKLQKIMEIKDYSKLSIVIAVNLCNGMSQQMGSCTSS